MAKKFDVDIFKEKMIAVEDNHCVVDLFKESAVILNLMMEEDDFSNIDLDDITDEHLDLIELHIMTTIDYIEGDVPLADVKENMIIEGNFKTNIEHLIKAKESLRTPNYYDLF